MRREEEEGWAKDPLSHAAALRIIPPAFERRRRLCRDLRYDRALSPQRRSHLLLARNFNFSPKFLDEGEGRGKCRQPVAACMVVAQMTFIRFVLARSRTWGYAQRTGERAFISCEKGFPDDGTSRRFRREEEFFPQSGQRYFPLSLLA